MGSAQGAVALRTAVADQMARGLRLAFDEAETDPATNRPFAQDNRPANELSRQAVEWMRQILEMHFSGRSSASDSWIDVRTALQANVLGSLGSRGHAETCF